MISQEGHDAILDRAYALWAAAGYPDLGAFAFYEQAKREIAVRQPMQQGIAASAGDRRHGGPSGPHHRR